MISFLHTPLWPAIEGDGTCSRSSGCLLESRQACRILSEHLQWREQRCEEGSPLPVYLHRSTCHTWQPSHWSRAFHPLNPCLLLLQSFEGSTNLAPALGHWQAVCPGGNGGRALCRLPTLRFGHSTVCVRAAGAARVRRPSSALVILSPDLRPRYSSESPSKGHHFEAHQHPQQQGPMCPTLVDGGRLWIQPSPPWPLD